MKPLLKTFNRVAMVVTFSATPRVLMDGIITNQQLSPGNEPGSSILTITGEDISVMMDSEEKSNEHPAQMETIIAIKIILSYAKYGLVPLVIPPGLVDPPIPVERTPVQQATDLQYLEEMARRHGYVFYVKPGPFPLQSTAYWGPRIRVGIPQPALSVNMGSDTNVESINFQNNALTPHFVSGEVQDRLTDKKIPIKALFSTRIPLVSQPSWLVHRAKLRRIQLRETGLNAMQAFARAQSMTDASQDEVVTASGELDALRYGNLLWPRELVGLRGAGYSYDGFYYVQSVTHRIRKDEYTQSFNLAREGIGALTPVVRP
jgi:hypothetical protein